MESRETACHSAPSANLERTATLRRLKAELAARKQELQETRTELARQKQAAQSAEQGRREAKARADDLTYECARLERQLQDKEQQLDERHDEYEVGQAPFFSFFLLTL